jgi:hypothetical protein
MKQELRQAGYRAYTWAEPTAPGALGTLTNECLAAGETAGTFVSNIRQGVWGANNSNPFSASCIPSTSYATGNDVLVVRRVASPPTGCPDGSSPPCADTLYFQSSYSTGQVFRGATAPVFADGLTPVASFPVQIYVYYISPFTVSERETPLVPALYRMALQSGGSMSRELVASGIEHFQVQYGRLTVAVPATTQFSDTLTGSSVNTVASDWDNVESVRIWLLARNETAEPGYSNTNSYVMGDQTYDFAAAPDGFRRQLFSTVVQLRN